MTDTPQNASFDDAALPADLARQVFLASPIGLAVIERSGEVVFANDRATQILNTARGDLVGRTYHSPDWEIYQGGGPVSADNHPVTRVFETGDPEYGYEHRIGRPDGSQRWITHNATPLLEDGAVEYVLVAFEDITELKRREERLSSQHMQRVEFRASRSAVPPSLRVERGEHQFEVESIVSLPDGATVQYMGTSDLPASDFVTAVEEVPHYVDVRLLSTIDGYSRIEARAESATVAEVFQSLGGRPLDIVVMRDEVRFSGVLPGDVDHRLAADGIAEFHPDIELVSEELVYSPHLLYDIVEAALTDRQLATLDAAYFSGYFDSPRTSTGKELAERFGVTRQTFNQHLRKAQQEVFRHLFEKSATGETD
ncbi:helix-turn-helix domain-containing protein [Natranaeroarchaeum aerophilus]|uniref:Helix-turn-helix domain-containing protein n=1 Tax=Natranaeroarchaeum aerophilus TaxID=2917711 RepID=A0AAE3FRP4_9EURY|nr:helix-turn-helix domain-containing protein [Natranaeroarchaeum aerophilus]MCL9814088.1 helix-turn-helix domain-containing protein [Natranaeroarchaeum aerophilus]